MRQISKNNRGFGVVDLLVGFALLAILTTLTAQLLTRMNLGAAQAAQKGETNTVISTVNIMLSSVEGCTTALKGQSYNAALGNNPVVLHNSQGGIYLKADPTKFDNGVSVSQMYLKQTEAEPRFATLHVVVNRTAVTNKKEYDYAIPLVVDIDPNTQQIKTCSMLRSTAADNYCYATRAERFSAPSCMRNYYLKALVRSVDDDWDGVGGVCCFEGDKDLDMENLKPAIQSGVALRGLKMVSSSIGKPYNDLVLDCRQHSGSYGEKDVRCPKRDDSDEVGDQIAPTVSFTTPTFRTVPANCSTDCTLVVKFNYTATDAGGLESLRVYYNSGDQDMPVGHVVTVPLVNGNYQNSFSGQVRKLVIPMVDAGQSVDLKVQVVDNAGNLGDPASTHTTIVVPPHVP